MTMWDRDKGERQGISGVGQKFSLQYQICNRKNLQVLLYYQYYEQKIKQNYLLIISIKITTTILFYYFFIISIQIKKYHFIMLQIPKCIKNNQGYIMCWTQNCKINPIICKDDNCQCSSNHDKCNINITVKRFFNHLNQLNKGIIDTYKLKKIMIDNLQKLRKQVNVLIDTQIGNIDEHLKNYETQESLNLKKLMEGNESWTSDKIEYYLKIKQIKLKFTDADISSLGEKMKGDFRKIKDNLKNQISKIMDKQYNKYPFDYNQQFKGTDIHLKSNTKNSLQFQHKANSDKYQDIILPKALIKTIKLYIHITNLKIMSNKPYWFYAGIINKTNIDFNAGNYSSSISVSTQDQLYGNIKKIQGNGIQQKNECLYELEYNKQSNYLLIKIGCNKYRLDNLPKSDYYVIIGMYTANSMVRIYE